MRDACRHLCLALGFMVVIPQGGTTSPMPAQYVVDINVCQGGTYLVLHALETFGAKAPIQCSQEPGFTTVECRSDGGIVMTAQVASANVHIIV
jgi:hypothetical protein